MAQSEQSIDNLQKALSMEMTAVQQYLLHAHMLDDWGLDILAQHLREEMKDELGHAGRFIERILFLGGEPVVAPAKTPKRAENLSELFRSDLAEEREAVSFYTEAAKAADADSDLGTRRLFENIVLDEEGHVEWLTRQLDLLDRMGEPNFMSNNMSKREAS